MQLVPNKRIFDTDTALKGTFNGFFGRWQLIVYSLSVFAFAIVSGWIGNLLEYNLLSPNEVDCDGFEMAYSGNNTKATVIQRFSGQDKYIINLGNETLKLTYNYTNPYGSTVVTEYRLFCDLVYYAHIPRYLNIAGSMFGALLLGNLADKGGRKSILLGCIWVTGVMSNFQLIGSDYVAYVFFQFFLGVFSIGVHVVFLPTILEMFPMSHRTFYGVFYHLIVAIFQLVLPLLAKAIQNWFILQAIVTIPLIITIPLQWLANESIFWHLSHKEYDKVIKILTKLAKRNRILFQTKFKHAQEFLHAKHSKAVQVDLLPLLRLKDLEQLGKKYPTIDMADVQKKQSNSKIRRFFSSFKGNNYRSTNTVYNPFDFIYSPTLLVYVLILCGLWFTHGLSESIETVRIKIDKFDTYINDCLVALISVISALVAIGLSFLRISRRWMIFISYVAYEICLDGLLLAKYVQTSPSKDTQAPLTIFYLAGKFASSFSLIFLMLATAELFPTNLRCTGMGICYTFKLVGTLLTSTKLLNVNDKIAQLIYGKLFLIFGLLALFVPETRNYPLPRSILQIEAMPTKIGKKLRSQKVQLACEHRRKQFPQYSNNCADDTNANGEIEEVNGNGGGSSRCSGRGSIDSDLKFTEEYARQRFPSYTPHTYSTYDTIASAHDIEQDAHVYYKDLRPIELTNISERSSGTASENSILDGNSIQLTPYSHGGHFQPSRSRHNSMTKSNRSQS